MTKAYDYAVKFVLETKDEPTDERIREVLSVCALRPPVRLYPAIRAEVITLRWPI